MLGCNKINLPILVYAASIVLAVPNTGIYAASFTEITGAVEAELGFAEDFEGESSSDIALATVEIALDAEISEWVGAHVLLLHEEDDTPLEVDEGIIAFSNSFLSAFSFQIGQQYVPFGSYETTLISDPLTLEIGETRESAAVFSYDDGLNFAFFLFNGELIETDADDSIDNAGISLGYVFEGEDLSINFGVSFINNIGESDGLSGVISENIPDTPVREYVAGTAGHLIIEWGSLVLIGELVAANSEFTAGEIYEDQAAKPSAANFEIAYNVTESLSIGAAMQQTVDLSGILPETRTLFGVGYAINDNTAIALEFAVDNDYDTDSPNGSGESANNITIQLATGF